MKLINARVWPIIAVVSFIAVVWFLVSDPPLTQIARTEEGGIKHYRGVIGKNSKKILVKDGKTFLWASGDLKDPDKAHWYDFTDSPIPAEQLQFGIGKDGFKAIDDPLFVKPDDPQLGRLSKGWYRRGKKVSSTDDIRVMGFVINDEARCYPSALLDRHELVNDRYGNKPVTVGW